MPDTPYRAVGGGVDGCEQKTLPFGWKRIQEEAQIVVRCEQMGGRLLNQPHERRASVGFQHDEEKE